MDKRSRTPVFAILIAIEIGIVGLAAYSIRGAVTGNALAGGIGGADFTAKSFAPISAGSTPRVTIDDPNSGVTISASTDGLVHVKDDTYFSGVTLRSPHDYPQLIVTHDFSSVHISRPAYHADWTMFIGISNSHQHFDVQVPAGASIVVAVDGRIELAGLDGAIVAHTDDGHIAADDITSPSLDLSSGDGWIEVRNLTTVAGGKYDVATKDGHIKVAFAHGSDVTVDASTNDGSLRVDGVRYHGDDSVRQTIRIGNGGSAMRVHSDDGSITITTNATN